MKILSNTQIEKKVNNLFKSTSGRRVKVRLKFSEPVYINGLTKRIKVDVTERGYSLKHNTKDTYTAYLFRNSDSHVTGICAKVNSKNGYRLDKFTDKLVSIELANTGPKKDWDQINRNYIINNTEEGAWTNLVESINETGESSYIIANNSGGRIKTVQMKSKFPDYVCKEIEYAFNNKTDYSYSKCAKGPQGRDLSVETKMYEDGIFRAWYSSEYSGCGNGDYYLLINPRTAIFYEKD